MKAHGLGPRDFVLLVRQRADRYAAVLEPTFRAAGIALRNEAGMVGETTLQELLPDEISRLLVSVLRLAMTARAGRYWTDSQETIGALRGISPDDGAAQERFAIELDRFASNLGKRYPAPSAAAFVATALTDEIVDFIGRIGCWLRIQPTPRAAGSTRLSRPQRFICKPLHRRRRTGPMPSMPMKASKPFH
jgi:hypothetical protein